MKSNMRLIQASPHFKIYEKIKMLDDLLTNAYIKAFIVIILALCLTFVHDLEIFKSRVILPLIGILTLLMMAHNVSRDFGIIILMTCLFVTVYNRQVINR